MPKPAWRCWLALIGLILGSPVWGQSRVADSALIARWDLGVAQADTVVWQRGQVLDLAQDHAFTLIQAGDTLTGTWHLHGDSLKLAFERTDQTWTADSVAYEVADGQPVVKLFHDGEAAATIVPEGLESARRQWAFAVTPSESGYILSGSEGRWQLDHREWLLRSPFSFEDFWRGILGLSFLVLVCWLFSSDRRAIDWRLVGIGLGLQVIFAFLVLKVPFVNVIFSYIAKGFVAILGWTEAGSVFLFDGLMNVPQSGYIFAFQVLPVIVFFSALTSLLYYLGVLQRVVYGFAWVMKRTMRLSGAESLAAAGNIFLGQTEAPLLIKPYLPNMTRSEIMSLMSGGMATIAGAVFGAYVGYLGGTDPVEQQIFATHLLTASIMSAPAAIVAAKMLVPEKEKFIENLEVPRDRIGSNVLDAITNGASEGLRLAVNVGIMLLVFIALIEGVNVMLDSLIGSPTNLNAWIADSTDGAYDKLSLEYLFGLLLSPIAWLLGVPAEDTMLVGQLLGEKTVANEFVAYVSLGQMKMAGSLTHFKSLIIATYALCGFANFASIGIQIGGIGALAPGKRVLLSELGMKALIGGTAAAFFTAVLAGMLTQL